MAIFRGAGGAGDSNTDATITIVTEQATIATTKASEAAASASNASTSETNALTSASTATTKASEASTSASNAATSEANAAASFDSFDDRYLGAKVSPPSTDNDGDALITGALYFDTSTDSMKVYSGSSWLDAYASLSGALVANNNLSDVNNVSTSRTNLGLGTSATTDSTDYATAAQGTTADAALPKAGGAMTGAITTNSTFDGRDVATDGTKLDGIEASADVTDATNVTAAGALMDSEVTNLAQVKAFDSSDYATATQGTTADDALPKAGGTVTGTVVFGAAITEDAETLTGTSTTIDLATATNFVHDLTGATTYTFSNPATTGNATAFTLKIIQDSTARAITWPASVDWAGGTAPTITATNNGVDVFVFYTIDGGTTYYGFTAGQAMA